MNRTISDGEFYINTINIGEFLDSRLKGYDRGTTVKILEALKFVIADNAQKIAFNRGIEVAIEVVKAGEHHE